MTRCSQIGDVSSRCGSSDGYQINAGARSVRYFKICISGEKHTIDNDEHGGSVCILQTPTQTEVFGIPALGDNSVQTIDLGGFGNVTKLTVKFVSSGAVAQICYCVPRGCEAD